MTNAAGVQGLGNNPFTISHPTYFWIICDAVRNELATVKLGDSADIRLNGYPDQKFMGTVSNIDVTLDPFTRTGKVRIEVKNPGLMRLGMFVTVKLQSRKSTVQTAVPADAVLNLHDRGYLYVPVAGSRFWRVEVTAGETLTENTQEIRSGLKQGQQFVANALVMQHTIEK